MKFYALIKLLFVINTFSYAEGLVQKTSGDYVTEMVRRELVSSTEIELRNHSLLKTKLSGLFRREAFNSELEYFEYEGKDPMANENWSMFLIAIMNTQDILLEYDKYFNESDKKMLKDVNDILSSLAKEVGGLYNFNVDKLRSIRNNKYNDNNFQGALMQKNASKAFIRKRNKDVGKVMSIWTTIANR